MTRLRSLLEARSALARDEGGAVTMEYTVILILVVVLSIVAWQSYQDTIEQDADQQYQTFGYPG